jgi:hypothetical protein
MIRQELYFIFLYHFYWITLFFKWNIILKPMDTLSTIATAILVHLRFSQLLVSSKYLKKCWCYFNYFETTFVFSS